MNLLKSIFRNCLEEKKFFCIKNIQITHSKQAVLVYLNILENKLLQKNTLHTAI